MIYPSYGLILPDELEDFVQVLEALSSCHINTADVKNFREFWVDGARQEAIQQNVPDFIPKFPYKDFIIVYCDFYKEMMSYVDSLDVGDTVIIEEARGDVDGNDYPYQFSPDMQDLAGEEFKIKGIDRCSYPMSLQYANGSDKCFYLSGAADGYTWHSSMFSRKAVKSVNKIEISPLIINPLDLSGLLF